MRHAGQPYGQPAHRFAGQGKHCIGHGRRGGRNAGLTHTAGRLFAADNMHIDVGAFFQAQQWIVIKVALLDLAAGDGDDALESLGLIPDDAGLDIRLQALETESDAYLVLGKAGPAVTALVKREALLVDPAASYLAGKLNPKKCYR